MQNRTSSLSVVMIYILVSMIAGIIVTISFLVCCSRRKRSALEGYTGRRESTQDASVRYEIVSNENSIPATTLLSTPRQALGIPHNQNQLSNPLQERESSFVIFNRSRISDTRLQPDLPVTTFNPSRNSLPRQQQVSTLSTFGHGRTPATIHHLESLATTFSSSRTLEVHQRQESPLTLFSQDRHAAEVQNQTSRLVLPLPPVPSNGPRSSKNYSSEKEHWVPTKLPLSKQISLGASPREGLARSSAQRLRSGTLPASLKPSLPPRKANHLRRSIRTQHSPASYSHMTSNADECRSPKASRTAGFKTDAMWDATRQMSPMSNVGLPDQQPLKTPRHEVPSSRVPSSTPGHGENTGHNLARHPLGDSFREGDRHCARSNTSGGMDSKLYPGTENRIPPFPARDLDNESADNSNSDNVIYFTLEPNSNYDTSDDES